ncbi:peptide chain release factor N(5)-glutamine methyltransferase [Phycicoccus endophyticus]|uniref:Release factor glutamine methyltransferase n=1 Tax=Phycicoccus endophyticus TaxID=1690220 RepID=A0A7G9QYL2_9MICO|nr:peptide chain release factor N(5)-glutamine methyltransferase [Phycicoccus endophyticus]NHI19341.1 peptide chain release factor N(5)-glutamine methyltransferase [Phycicoccus endophyticus]QNN48437.1 peptide chain release factor N(5)-glutamine methyltransferase [Phycicoccus endophyticus]GGL41979.1 release factor glutamine methyltransferase [Phycicoccus endophyticus]
MTTLDVVLARARRELAAAGVPSPEVDALELAGVVLGTDTGEVRRRQVLCAPLADADVARLEELLAQRARRVPLQHLTGRAHFRGLVLYVGPGVFVPRPETEVTAGLAIEAARAHRGSAVVVDLGTGSGAIALAVAEEVPGARVHAVELSPQAHAWAERNVAEHGGGVELRLGDATTAFEDLEGVADVVVSNPPYIPDGAVPVDPEVREHDPELALYGRSADGLAVPLAVAARAAVLLAPGGTLVMEHADEQGASLPAALRRTGAWEDVADHADLAGRPRVTVATRRR